MPFLKTHQEALKYLQSQSPKGLAVVTCMTADESFYKNEIFLVGKKNQNLTVEILRKVPQKCLLEIIEYFRRDLSKESLARIYFRDGRFWVDYPQIYSVTATAVGFKNPEGGKGLLVCEIHSHNKMRAFFSAVDNHDEVYPGLYGVIGCLDCEEPEMRFRAVFEGASTRIAKETLFTEGNGQDQIQRLRRSIAETIEIGIAKVEGLAGEITDSYCIHMINRFLELSKSLGFERLQSGLHHAGFDYDFQMDVLIVLDMEETKQAVAKWIADFERDPSSQTAVRYELACVIYAKLRSGQYICS